MFSGRLFVRPLTPIQRLSDIPVLSWAISMKTWHKYSSCTVSGNSKELMKKCSRSEVRASEVTVIARPNALSRQRDRPSLQLTAVRPLCVRRRHIPIEDVASRLTR